MITNFNYIYIRWASNTDIDIIKICNHFNCPIDTLEQITLNQQQGKSAFERVSEYQLARDDQPYKLTEMQQ